MQLDATNLRVQSMWQFSFGRTRVQDPGGAAPADPPLELFQGGRRMRLWTLVVALPSLAVLFVPLAAGKVPHAGPARVIGNPELVLTGVLLSIAGLYDLAVTPLRSSRTALKVELTLFGLAAFFPAVMAYVRVARVPEELPNSFDVGMVVGSFAINTFLGSLAAWKAAKG
jgi:hypothetical protein